MEGFLSLLALGFTLLALVALVGIVVPIPRIGLRTRKRSLGILGIAFVGIIVAGSLLPGLSGESQRAGVQPEELDRKTNSYAGPAGAVNSLDGAPQIQASLASETSKKVASNAELDEGLRSELDSWVAHEYAIVEEQDISTGLRKRVRVSITSPDAVTPESRVMTAMEAAVHVHRKAELPQFVTVFLQQAGVSTTHTLAKVDFAPDGCGVSGDDCTGDIWTGISASLSRLTEEEIAIANAWNEYEPQFWETVGEKIEDEAHAGAMEELKSSYSELMEIKDKADFETFGFSPKGPYGNWMKKVRRRQDDYPNLYMYADVSFGDLLSLATAYVSSKGQETDFTRWSNEEFAVVTSSKIGEVNSQQFNKDALVEFLAAKLEMTQETVENAYMQSLITATSLEGVRLPDQIKDFGSLSEEEKKRACRWDLQCWGDENSLGATMACEEHIEDLSLYAHEWTDGWLGVKFSRFRWRDRDAGAVTYMGDEIQFQNGFGAWVRHRYWCDYDTLGKSAISVRAEPGRL